MTVTDFMRQIEPEAIALYADSGAKLEQALAVSQAISLKRIADRLECFDPDSFRNQLLDIAYQAGVNFRGHA